jgi:hypothetical protein
MAETENPEAVAPVAKVQIFDTCPPEKTILRILLVSGQKCDFQSLPSDNVETFLQIVFENWPQGSSSPLII